ncbi:ATP-binding protein [Klebsiella pneumoniae]|nr:ATP-binding protein [Klebsiella pneumoniae]
MIHSIYYLNIEEGGGVNKCILIKSIENEHLNVDLTTEKVNGSSYFSVIVGRNGCGKSRLLEQISQGALINSFAHNSQSLDVGKNFHPALFKYDSSSSFGWEYKFLFKLEYELNGVANFIFAYMEYGVLKYCNSTSEVVPKIICISNSPFNRFMPTEKVNHLYESYGYFGYRNLTISDIFFEMGTTSVRRINHYYFTVPVMASFLSSVRQSQNSFKFLEYFGFNKEVRISVDLAPSLGVFFETPVLKEDISRDFLVRCLNSLNLRVSISIEDSLVDCLYAFIHEIIKQSNNDGSPFFSLRGITLELTPDVYFDEGFYQKLIYLSNWQFIISNTIELKKGMQNISLGDLSSGESNIIITLFNINRVIEDNSLILIDEPEISLHPKWQETILPALKDCFSLFLGCHFIIATHSPQVVASIPEENSSLIIIDENCKTISGKLVRGKSADYQLFSVLGYSGNQNEYLTRILMIVISKLTKEEVLTDNELMILDKASELLVGVDDDDLTKYLLKQALALL